MGCLSYCRKGPASQQFAQSAQWCKQRYCIDLIYPILLLAIQPFALLAVGLPAVSSRWCSCQHLRHGAPASNKPHPAEKSTPVWLAIWRIWAGFANSQLRRAAFRCTSSYICTHPRYCRLEPLLRQTQICRPICADCLRHLRISAG